MERDKVVEFFDGKGKGKTVPGEQGGDAELNEHIEIWNSSCKDTNRFNPDTDKAWNCIKSRFSTETASRKLNFAAIYWAAASILLVVAGYLMYSSGPTFGGESRQVVDAASEVRVLDLTDGSTVWLNKGSRVYYNSENPRNLILEGEGYFKVAPDAHSPFTVDAGGVRTVVLGTEFNVSTQQNKIVVDVVTGQVQVNALDRSTLATANTRVEVLKDDKVLRRSIVDNQNFLFWKTGILEFENVSLGYILETVNKYHRSRVYASADLEKCNLTVRFQHNTLEESLDILATLLNGTVVNEGAEYHLKGNSCL